MQQIDSFRKELNRVYCGEYPFPYAEEHPESGYVVPFLDIYEIADEIIVSCYMPGIKNEDDVQIVIENKVLTITGTTENELQANYNFQRSATLPMNASSENTHAIYQHNILNVHIAKAPVKAKKTVKIEFK